MAKTRKRTGLSTNSDSAPSL